MGTVTPSSLEDYTIALKAYNTTGAPVLLDPVGAGATTIRKAAVKSLLSSGYFTVIKGNEAEITQVWATTTTTTNNNDETEAQQQHGVDSGPSKLDHLSKTRLVRALASRERNVVLMTGVIDYLSDGTRTYAISNGHEYLSLITGSGCVLGTTIAAMLPVCKHDPLLATLAGLLWFELAAEDVKYFTGPGTFVPMFLDNLYAGGMVARDWARSNVEWIEF